MSVWTFAQALHTFLCFGRNWSLLPLRRLLPVYKWSQHEVSSKVFSDGLVDLVGPEVGHLSAAATAVWRFFSMRRRRRGGRWQGGADYDGRGGREGDPNVKLYWRKKKRRESISYTMVGPCWDHRAWTEVRVQQQGLMCGRDLWLAEGGLTLFLTLPLWPPLEDKFR